MTAAGGTSIFTATSYRFVDEDCNQAGYQAHCHDTARLRVGHTLTRGADGKLPLHWFDVPSRPIVSFAGMWRPTEAGAVFAFLTSEPNPLVAPIHPKAMPVLLDEEDEERWLTCSFDDAVALAKPYSSQLMSAVQADPKGTVEVVDDTLSQPTLDLD